MGFLRINGRRRKLYGRRGSRVTTPSSDECAGQRTAGRLGAELFRETGEISEFAKLEQFDSRRQRDGHRRKTMPAHNPQPSSQVMGAGLWQSVSQLMIQRIRKGRTTELDIGNDDEEDEAEEEDTGVEATMSKAFERVPRRNSVGRPRPAETSGPFP